MNPHPAPSYHPAVLRAFAEDLWLAEGPIVQFLGLFPYPTRMAVVRQRDGGLWVWSPIALDDATAAEVEGLGPVRDLVAPNKLHHLYLGEWAERFPDARLHAPPGLARKRADLRFAGELGAEPDGAWADEIDQVVFGGSLLLDEVVFFHRASRTALFCDLIQRFEPESVRGFRGATMKLWGLVGASGSTPREWRASFWNRRAARAARQRVRDWKPERLVVAHGMCAADAGREAMERGLRWLR